ncbi:MAG: glycosyltransferase family 1 protein [Deltaproteobacteria bacterium]|nr:MAG: glycosyltransferase family 1 protein [Deltaproteobacteria bacterium]
MNITFLTTAWGVSGAEEHLLDLAKFLKEQKVALTFAVRQGSLFEKRVSSEGFPFVPLERKGPGLLLSPITLARHLIHDAPDVLSVNREHDILLGYLASKMASPFRKRRGKLVAVFHTPTGRKIPLLKKFDGVVCTSEYTKNAFSRHNPELEETARVIHYGIDLWHTDKDEKLNAERKRRFFQNASFPLIGMIGELWKNQEELVDVAKHLVPNFPNLKIAIVGGGWKEQVESLKRKIDEAGLTGNFILTGRVPRGKIPDIFFDLDLSVSTHRNEGFGIVHIESLASYTPVVAYRAGGYVEMLSRGGGILVDGGPEELARAIARLLSNHDERKRLALEGRKIVEEYYTIERMGRDHLSFYESIVAGRTWKRES